jgi:hypothetical protein
VRTKTATPTDYLQCAGQALAGITARNLNKMGADELGFCSFERRQANGPCQPTAIYRGTAAIVGGKAVFTITTEEV